jgi:hypothetical protein
MSRDRPTTSEEDRAVRQLFHEAHRGEVPPPFEQTWRATLNPESPRRARWALAPALGLSAALLLFWGLRPIPSRPAFEEPIEYVEWKAPLDFLLITPGSELLQTVPKFDTKGMP